VSEEVDLTDGFVCVNKQVDCCRWMTCIWCCSGAQSQPVRTLEERKAAYAAARLRILGSAAESNTPTTTTTTRTSKLVVRLLQDTMTAQHIFEILYTLLLGRIAVLRM